jgi:hypothetical protein
MRKILEDLILIGNLQESYTLFNREWVLKTLNSDEMLQVTNSTRDYDQLSRLQAIKLATLARSIVEVNNVELKDINEKIEFLSQLQQPIIDLLYTKYMELQKKQDDEFKAMETGKDLKN